MAQTVLLKRSSVAGNVPGSSDLSLGEIAVNTADGAVYIKKGNNDIVAVADNDILHIDTTNSRIGINKSSPNYRLDVGGNIHSTAAYIDGYIYHTGDTDTYINYSTDNVIISAGAQQTHFKGSGRVGIGTSSPNANLHIGSASATGDATNPALQIGGTTTYRLGMYTTTEGGVIDAANGDDGLQFHTKNVGEAVRITANGNLQMVGQTTTFENAALTHHTNNYLYLRGGSSGLILSDDSGINTVQIIDGSAGYINFETGNGSSRMRIDSTGKVGIGTSSPQQQLTVGTLETSSIVTHGTVGIKTASDNKAINIQENSGVEGWGFGVDVSGNLNFYDSASTDPSVQFIDNGGVKFNNAYTFPTADGSANQVLQTDGSGNLSFATVSGGGGVSISNNVNNRVLTGDGTNANAEANLTFDGSTLDVAGNVIIDTNPAGTYGVSEALRIDDVGNTNDRALQFFELCNAGARSHRLAYNTNITTTGSAYVYTQGNYGGSSALHFGNSGEMVFYVDAQDTSGSTTAITPTERFRIHSDGDVRFDGGNVFYDTSQNALNFIDNVSAQFGTGNDLQIYHDGSHSYIKDAGTGNLQILATNLQLNNSANSQNMITATDGGAVTLFTAGSAKLATTSTGIDVTGVITTDGLTTSADINFGDDDKALFGAGNDLKIYHSANNQSYIHEVGSGDLNILATNLKLQDSGGSTKVLVNSSGINVTGTVTADGVSVDGNINLGDNDSIYLGDSNDLRIYHDSGSSLIRNTTGSLYIQDDDGHVYIRPKSGQDGLVAIADGAVTLHHSGNAKLATKSDGVDITGELQSDSLDVDGNADISGNLNTGPKVAIRNGTTYVQSTDYLYIGGSGLDGSDAAIYLGNNGAGNGYGWRFFYEGSGTGNLNKLIIRSENSGSPVDALSFTQDGNATFAGEIYAKDSNSSTTPSITFTGHTNTGLSVYQSNSVDRLSIITGGGQRANFGTHGVESFANVYTGNTSSFRNYAGTWTATTGVTGNGFNFINSVDGTALTLSSTGNAVFAGTLEATSFSDGTISGITFIDEDSFSTNSATRVPTQQSIKAYVDAQVAGVVDTAPAALNTLNELAAALGDDANFSTTTSTALGNRLRVDTASQGLTGTQQANAITNLGITATKAELNYVDGVTSNIQTQLNTKLTSSSTAVTNKLPLAGGTMTGNINLNGNNLNNVNLIQFQNEELTTFTGARQMIIDANDGDSNVPSHGDYAGSYPFGIYFTGDNDASTTTLGSGLVKVWHTGHFNKSHIDYFVGLYNTGVTTTEFDYLDGVTSNIQTQLNGKLSTSGTASHANNLNAFDDRDIAPEDLNYGVDFRIYFAEKGGLETGTIGTNYQDVLVLNSYTDATGGDANALAFDKSEKKIYHYQADQAATNWGTAKTLAYIDDNITGTSAGLSGTPNISVGTISATGEINTTAGTPSRFNGGISVGADDDIYFYESATGTGTIRTGSSGSYKYFNFKSGGQFNAPVSFQVAGSEFIDSSRNITAGNITVSGTVDGRDVAADGTKLDGIESGATADQTASEILTAIKTVDGSGSGLDADTLDGTDSTSFRRRIFNTSITATPEARWIAFTKPFISGNGSSEYYHLDLVGYSDIGATQSTLHYSAYIHVRSNGTSTNTFEVIIEERHKAGSDQFTFGKKQVASTSNIVYFILPEDYSGVEIYNLSDDAGSISTASTSMFSTTDTDPTGITTITPREPLHTNDNISVGTINTSGNITAGNDINISGNELTFTNDAASAYIRGADALLIQSDYNTGENKPIYLQPSATTELTVATGQSTFVGNVDVGSGLDVTGNITVTGTVDGRDVAADGTKLDTIATNADVTPSWVPSSDPSYLTSSSTQSKYLRSDANDDFSGTLNYTPDTGTILSVDGQAILQRMTANGAITIGHDDAVIIAGGDTSQVLNANITNATETVFLGAEGGVIMYAFPNNDTTWTNRRFFSFDGANGLNMNNVFTVDINGNLSATTKSFDIEHPSKKGMRLRYGSLEGPENGVYVRGKSKEKVISLPDYWVDLIHEDSITVQLTAIGGGQNLYVEDIKDNKVYVNGENYFYYIQAERKDVERFEVEYEV